MSVSVSTSIELEGLHSLWDPANKRCINVPKLESIGGQQILDLGAKSALFAYGLTKLDDAGFISFRTDQNTDYLGIPVYTIPLSAFTLNFWFRSRFTDDTQTLFAYSVSGDSEVVIQAASPTSFRPIILGYGDFRVATTDMKDKWVNFTWSRDTTTGRNTFYRDGEKIGELFRDSLNAPRTGGALTIGQMPAIGVPIQSTFTVNTNLDGDFGPCIIYDRELSAASIKKNYHALRTRFGY